jgi:hypothetical protein
MSWAQHMKPPHVMNLRERIRRILHTMDVLGHQKTHLRPLLLLPNELLTSILLELDIHSTLQFAMVGA